MPDAAYTILLSNPSAKPNTKPISISISTTPKIGNILLFLFSFILASITKHKNVNPMNNNCPISSMIIMFEGLVIQLIER